MSEITVPAGDNLEKAARAIMENCVPYEPDPSQALVGWVLLEDLEAALAALPGTKEALTSDEFSVCPICEGRIVQDVDTGLVLCLTCEYQIAGRNDHVALCQKLGRLDAAEKDRDEAILRMDDMRRLLVLAEGKQSTAEKRCAAKGEK